MIRRFDRISASEETIADLSARETAILSGARGRSANVGGVGPGTARAAARISVGPTEIDTPGASSRILQTSLGVEVRHGGEQDHLGGHVALGVKPADQRQRGPLEDLLDDGPDL